MLVAKGNCYSVLAGTPYDGKQQFSKNYMNNEIRGPEDLAKKIAEAMAKGESFLINATFGSGSVFFIGGNVNNIIKQHAQSVDAMFATFIAPKVNKDDIKLKRQQEYIRNEDGTCVIKFYGEKM